MKVMIQSNCCELGKLLQFIAKEDCRRQDIEEPASAFYIDVNYSYPDPAWEKISYCPFCGADLVVPT